MCPRDQIHKSVCCVFRVYLTTLSVAQTVLRRVRGCLIDDEFLMIWCEAAMA
jgi:hypothetical protein